MRRAVSHTERARGELGTSEALRRGGNIPEQVFDQRRQSLLTARAEVDRAQAALKAAEASWKRIEPPKASISVVPCGRKSWSVIISRGLPSSAGVMKKPRVGRKAEEI